MLENMQCHYNRFILPFIGLAPLLVGLFAGSFAFAKGQTPGANEVNRSMIAQSTVTHLVSMHTVDMVSVPVAAVKPLQQPPMMIPLLTGASPAVYNQRKEAAAHNTQAPVATLPFSNSDSTVPLTPALTSKFKGMVDSPSTCPYFGGCQPPDQVLAASPSWVFQGVNTSFAVYNTAGALQPGWPKSAQNFFGIPNPGSCDPRGAFVVDPRGFYDPADSHFWAIILQDQGALRIDSCPELALVWIGVSQTSNPNGKWNMYAFDIRNGTTNATDFTQAGFDGQAIYFSGNMFNQAGDSYQYAEVFAASKALMEAGSTHVTAQGFTRLQANGILVDSVQPVETQALGGAAPGAELLLSYFNINSGGGNCSTGCSGVVAWAFANPLATPSLTQVVVPTHRYTLPPQADQPGCKACLESFDPRISATPVYNNGKISFALESGVNNGTQVVPGILWGQVQPALSGGTLTSATLVQKGILAFTGDTAASFGALMPDKNDNLFMVFDMMSSTLAPSIKYTARLATDPLGKFEKPLLLMKGSVPTRNVSWGDYEATSYDGGTTNHIWLSAEYAGASTDWATEIGETHF
jgi:hypothetical protein